MQVYGKVFHINRIINIVKKIAKQSMFLKFANTEMYICGTTVTVHLAQNKWRAISEIT